MVSFLVMKFLSGIDISIMRSYSNAFTRGFFPNSGVKLHRPISLEPGSLLVQPLSISIVFADRGNAVVEHVPELTSLVRRGAVQAKYRSLSARFRQRLPPPRLRHTLLRSVHLLPVTPLRSPSVRSQPRLPPRPLLTSRPLPPRLNQQHPRPSDSRN
jgi:hypothetical protein